MHSAHYHNLWQYLQPRTSALQSPRHKLSAAHSESLISSKGGLLQMTSALFVFVFVGVRFLHQSWQKYKNSIMNPNHVFIRYSALNKDKKHGWIKRHKGPRLSTNHQAAHISLYHLAINMQHFLITNHIFLTLIMLRSIDAVRFWKQTSYNATYIHEI